MLLLDKPQGISSNSALQQAKRLFQAAKAGHTGNLDPVATGLLPICFGEATKFSRFLLESDKTYQAVFKLGMTTSTGDAEGEILSRKPVSLSRTEAEKALLHFVGEIQQIPPMHSAIKHQGRALYSYAREGIEIERAPRQVTIYSLRLDHFDADKLAVTVACSKGTYIRTLAEDVGWKLGCGAFMQSLRRIGIGEFDISRALTLEQLERMSLAERDAALLPVDRLLSRQPGIMLDRESAYYIRQGQAVWKAGQIGRGLVRLYDEKQIFLGAGEITDDGKIAPRRLVVSAGQGAE